MEIIATPQESFARHANSPEAWSQIWRREGTESWRQGALSAVYARIRVLVEQHGAEEMTYDLGGGIGLLADRLDGLNIMDPEIWEHGDVVDIARNRGHAARIVDLESDDLPGFEDGSLIFSTETIEHLSEAARTRIFDAARDARCHVMVSVPNNRLGPDEEPQHTVMWTPLQFLQYLRRWYSDARVEVVGGYLLGICGYPRPYKLSVTMPVRDEAEDIERTLASFRGVADEIVIGVDPRTTDNTRELARKYAETVFDLVDPQGPPGDQRAETGVHFAWVRNQCINRCTGDWIFMSEGHEYLEDGHDALLRLHDLVPSGTRVGFVLRRIGTQQWGFPWLFVRAPDIRFIRHTHNSLDFPEGTFVVHLPQVATRHSRHHDREAARQKQRKTQNRRGLLDDWIHRGSSNSLYYLAAEWRGYDPLKSREYFEAFLVQSHNGPQRYQARMELAVSYARDGMLKECRQHLHAAGADDWSRTEHFLCLGDLAYEAGQFEQAHRFYRLSSVGIGHPPFALWWIETSFYSYVPAQRLAMVCCELGRYDEALRWARRASELLPEDAPEEIRTECAENVAKLEEVLSAT